MRKRPTHKRTGSDIPSNTTRVNETLNTQPRSTSAISGKRRVVRTLVKGLSPFQLKKLYKAKCDDLNIPVLPEQESKFFSMCVQHFKYRKFTMKEMNLGVCSARAIGQILSSNPEFAYLDLSKNMLGDAGAVQLVKRLKKNNALVHLDLSSNDISPIGARKVFQLLKGHQSVVSLDISSHEGLHRNKVGASIEVLSEVLNLSQVWQLNLTGTCLGNQGMKMLQKGVQGNTKLFSLNLSKNGLSRAGISCITQAIAYSGLKELVLSQNKLGNGTCEELSTLLIGGFQKQRFLERLDLSNNKITVKGVFKLLGALRQNSYLKKLNLKNNDLSKGLSSECLPFLQTNTGMEQLNLSYCKLTDTGVVAFAEGLASNKSLIQLNLSHNLLSDPGATSLSQGLVKNSNLKSLNLSHNKIRSPGGIIIANMLKFNSSLEKVSLIGNCFKDDVGDSFKLTLMANTNLIELNLQGNSIDIKYLEDLKKLIKKNLDNYNRNIVPELRQKVDEMQVNRAVSGYVNALLKNTNKEKVSYKRRLKRESTRFHQVRQSEYQKTSLLLQQKNRLKSDYHTKSAALTALNHEIVELQAFSSKTIEGLSRQLEIQNKYLKKQQKYHRKLTEEISLKKQNIENTKCDLQEELSKEIIANRAQTNLLNSLKNQLENNRKTVSVLKKRGCAEHSSHRHKPLKDIN